MRREGELVSVSRSATAQAALAIGALGVVFGDIGTSPLYTIQTVFNPGDPHPVKVSQENIFGTVSLIFWSVTIIVTVIYVLLVMRADNDGEGRTRVGRRPRQGHRRCHRGPLQNAVTRFDLRVRRVGYAAR